MYNRKVRTLTTWAQENEVDLDLFTISFSSDYVLEAREAQLLKINMSTQHHRFNPVSFRALKRAFGGKLEVKESIFDGRKTVWLLGKTNVGELEVTMTYNGAFVCKPKEKVAQSDMFECVPNGFKKDGSDAMTLEEMSE